MREDTTLSWVMEGHAKWKKMFLLKIFLCVLIFSNSFAVCVLLALLIYLTPWLAKLWL